MRLAHSTAERQTTSSAAILLTVGHCIIRAVAADATRMLRDAAGRLAGERDRHGSPLTALHWTAAGLQRAEVRTAGGAWVAIEPGAGAPGPWGASDLVVQDRRPLTRFAALDWRRVDRVPPLAEPARLPPGAGTAILNLLARLALEHGVTSLRYDGPYPTEALFLALLESFRYAEVSGDPLAAFMAGDLAWRPAPYEAAVEAGGAWVQWRDGRADKIVADGRVYYRPDWQGVRRRGAHVVRDAQDTTRASLRVLDRIMEDHVILDADGAIQPRPSPPTDTAPAIPWERPLVTGLVATVAALSAPALREPLRALEATLAVSWSPVQRDLAVVDAAGLRVSHRMRRVLAARARTAGSPHAALELALAALGEIAHAVGDALRARAQARLAGATPQAQVTALEQARGADRDDARRIAAAAAALLAAAQEA
jgi:YD repeat-containing protein